MADEIYNLELPQQKLSEEDVYGLISDALQNFAERARIQKGYIQTGSGSNAGGISTAGSASDIIFWAGANQSSRASAPFRVDAAGNMYASSVTLPGIITYKNGVATRAVDAATASVTYAHGLGKVPTRVNFTALYVGSGAGGATILHSFGVYNASTTACVYFERYSDSSVLNTAGTSSSNMVSIGGGNAGQTATISIDSTNITLSWTRVSTGITGNIGLMWEAFA